METYYFNKQVEVDAVYFRGQGRPRAFPKHMWYGNRDVTFQESGLQYLVRRGKKAIKLFDMTDGHTNYRLKHDPEDQTWTLVRIAPAR